MLSNISITRNSEEQPPEVWTYQKAVAYIQGFNESIERRDEPPPDEAEMLKLWIRAENDHEKDIVALCLAVHMSSKNTDLANYLEKGSSFDTSRQASSDWANVATALRYKL